MVGTEHIFGLKINTGNYSQFIERIFEMAENERSAMTCVANVHMFMEAIKDRSFFPVINNADLVTPDGLPLCWALRILKGIRQGRVDGMGLLPELLGEASNKLVPVFFYGGSQIMLNKAEEHIRQNYPGIVLSGFYSPPFRELSAEEENNIIEKINASGARLVFVILGCPKQEKWMFSMRGKINAVMIGIGGALPVLAGMQPRAPKWMQKSGLEWLFRLSREPRRLFKRYATTNFLFIYLLLREKFQPRNKVL